MKSIKTQIIYIFLCMVLSFLIVPQLGAQDVPQEVIQAAEEGLPVYLGLISKQAEENPVFDKEGFGFKENDLLDHAYLGEAFKLHKITTDTILNYKRGSTVESLLSKTDLWYFLVMINEEPRVILLVDKMNDAWQAVGLGGAELAAELGEIRQQWPKGANYTPLLIECHNPEMFLFTVPQYDAYNLTPLVFPSAEGVAEESASYSELGDSYGIIKEFQSKIQCSQVLTNG